MRYSLEGNLMGYKSGVAKIAIKLGSIAYVAGVAIDTLYGHNLSFSLTNPQNIGGGIGIGAVALIFGISYPLYDKWKMRRHKNETFMPAMNSDS